MSKRRRFPVLYDEFNATISIRTSFECYLPDQAALTAT